MLYYILDVSLCPHISRRKLFEGTSIAELEDHSSYLIESKNHRKGIACYNSSLLEMWMLRP
jgi:hypothetical protein